MSRPGMAIVVPLGGLLGLCLAAGLGAGPERGEAGRLTVYVGTYTGGTSRGIYRFTLDATSGATSAPVLAAESENPSFLALSPNGERLYAVNETDHFDAQGSGAVSAFVVDRDTGALRALGSRSSRGADPCHLVVDGAHRHVLVANYGGGNLAVLPVRDDGSLGPATGVRAHSSPGAGGKEPVSPHAHAVVFDPGGSFVLAADLGLDRVFVYRLDEAGGTLEPAEAGAAVLEPGAGPRHLAFHPTGRVVYVINELASTVTVLGWDEKTGRLVLVQTVSTLPPGFEGENSTAEIAVSPDGRFVYGSNRGHDSLAVFRVDPVTLQLAPAGHVPTGGRTPRHFVIDSTGRWLLAANQDSGTIVVFRRDETSGLPAPTGQSVRVDRPVCLLPVPASR